MTWVFVGITIICWGIGQTLLKIGFQKSTPIDSFLMGGFIGAIVGAPYIIYQGVSFEGYQTYFPVMLAITLSYLTYYYCLNAGELSTASAILGAYPIATVLFAVLVLGETLAFKQYFGLFFVMAGVIALSTNFSQKKEMSKEDKIWIVFSIISSILIGISDALSNFVIDHTSPATYLLYFGIIQICLGMIFKTAFEGRNFNLSFLRSKYSIIGMFLLNIGGLAFTIALSYNQASLVVPISAAYLAIIPILSWHYLGEKFTAFKTLAIVSIIAGTMLV